MCGVVEAGKDEVLRRAVRNSGGWREGAWVGLLEGSVAPSPSSSSNNRRRGRKEVMDRLTNASNETIINVAKE